MLAALLLSGCGRCYASFDEGQHDWAEAFCTRAVSCDDFGLGSYDNCMALMTAGEVSSDCDFQGCDMADCVERYRSDPQCEDGRQNSGDFACLPFCARSTPG